MSTPPPLISMVEDAHSTACRDVSAAAVIEAIRAGKWRVPVEIIRAAYSKAYEGALAAGGNTKAATKAAKEAVDALKKALPGVLFSGQFSVRNGDSLITHSGLLCADLDHLGDCLQSARDKLVNDPHCLALFTSPTETGLKVLFRVPAVAEAGLHINLFHAVKQHCLEAHGLEVDESCKEVNRLCFVSYDPATYFNLDAAELPVCITEPPKTPKTPKAAKTKAKTTKATVGPNKSNLTARQEIAEKIFGSIKWDSGTEGFGQCPGQHLHTSENGERDFKIMLDGAPTATCFHDSCRALVNGANHELRSQIGKAEATPADDDSSPRQDDEKPERNPSAA